jgi:hypothetical protein
MDRYAVLNPQGKVINVIAWDGEAKWAPPEGHTIQRHEDVGIGDIWIAELNDFVRPLKNLKAPEDDLSISQRKQEYEKHKALLKSSMLFLDHEGTITA